MCKVKTKALRSVVSEQFKEKLLTKEKLNFKVHDKGLKFFLVAVFGSYFNLSKPCLIFFVATS